MEGGGVNDLGREERGVTMIGGGDNDAGIMTAARKQ